MRETGTLICWLTPGNAKLLNQPAMYFAELLNVRTAERIADYEHQYWQNFTGITRNKYQKGSSYYIGSYVDKEILKEIYRRGLEDAGLEKSEYQFPVIFRSGKNRKGQMIHYLLHYSRDRREIACPYEQVQELLSGREYRKGDKISLSDWDTLVLCEKE